MTKILDVLILDDEPIVGKRLQSALSKAGYNIESFDNPHDAVTRLDEKEFDIVVTDIRMKDINGMMILDRVMDQSPRTKVIMITGYATLELARESLAKGAFDFIAKPFKPSELREVIARASDSLGIKELQEKRI